MGKAAACVADGVSCEDSGAEGTVVCDSILKLQPETKKANIKNKANIFFTMILFEKARKFPRF